MVQNRYSKTTISMDVEDADLMLISKWDRAYDAMNPEIEGMINKYNLPPMVVRGLVSLSISALEDELREEWGIISRIPEWGD